MGAKAGDRCRVSNHLGRLRAQADSAPRYLDGEALSDRQGNTVNNPRLPSGDGVRGGDFEMWFWVIPPLQPAPPAPVDINTATRVDGIGPETLERIAPYVIVTGP